MSVTSDCNNKCSSNRGIYYISVRVYELTNAKSDPEFMISLIEELIQSDLEFYFRDNVPKHKKIVQAYEHEYE